jgi:hypothetical protein
MIRALVLAAAVGVALGYAVYGLAHLLAEGW